MVVLKNTSILEFHPDTLEFVRKAYNLETEERRKEALDILEDWVNKQLHFVKRDFSRDYLERTLIACKGLVERTKSRIDKLCTFRTLMPEMFPRTASKKDYEKLLKYAYQAELPKMTKEYYRIYALKVVSDNFTSEDLYNCFKYIVLLCEYSKTCDYSFAYVIVVDCRDVNFMNLVANCPPLVLKNMFTVLSEGFSIIIKQIHFIVPSKMVDILLSIAKQILSAKIVQRIHTHKTVDTLYEFLPKAILPEEFGGEERSLKQLNEKWLDAISEPDFVEYFEEMKKSRTDESCRQADKFTEQYIGMPGSFRALSVD